MDDYIRCYCIGYSYIECYVIIPICGAPAFPNFLFIAQIELLLLLLLFVVVKRHVGESLWSFQTSSSWGTLLRLLCERRGIMFKNPLFLINFLK
jgi:hypothetical protein